MKKILNFLCIAFAVVLISSCSDGKSLREKVRNSNATFDTLITMNHVFKSPLLSPWYDCNKTYKGNLKLSGWVNDTISTTNLVKIPMSTLEERFGVIRTPKKNQPTEDFWTRSDFPFWWIMAFIALILIIFWFIKRFARGSDSHPSEEKSKSTPLKVADPIMPLSTKESPSPSSNSSTISTSSFKEESDMLSEIMKEMKTSGMSEAEAEFPSGLKIKMKAPEKKQKTKKKDKKSKNKDDKKS